MLHPRNWPRSTNRPHSHTKGVVPGTVVLQATVPASMPLRSKRSETQLSPQRNSCRGWVCGPSGARTVLWRCVGEARDAVVCLTSTRGALPHDSLPLSLLLFQCMTQPRDFQCVLPEKRFLWPSVANFLGLDSGNFPLARQARDPCRRDPPFPAPPTQTPRRGGRFIEHPFAIISQPDRCGRRTALIGGAYLTHRRSSWKKLKNGRFGH